MVKKDLIKFIESLDENKLKEVLSSLNLKIISDYDWRSVTSYEVACKFKEVDEEDKINESDSKKIKAFKKLLHIFKVINKDWAANWKDSNQPKYYPWFKANEDGVFVFVSYYYNCNDVSSNAGSGLCTSDGDKATFIGETFIDLYNDLFS